MYLDPGSGSVFLQILLAFLFGAGALVRIFWGKIKSFFGKHDSVDSEKRNNVNNHDKSI